MMRRMNDAQKEPSITLVREKKSERETLFDLPMRERKGEGGNVALLDASARQASASRV